LTTNKVNKERYYEDHQCWIWNKCIYQSISHNISSWRKLYLLNGNACYQFTNVQIIKSQYPSLKEIIFIEQKCMLLVCQCANHVTTSIWFSNNTVGNFWLDLRETNHLCLSLRRRQILWVRANETCMPCHTSLSTKEPFYSGHSDSFITTTTSPDELPT